MPTKLSNAGLFFVIGGLFCLVNSSVLIAEANEANHYIEFYEEWDEDCEEKGGARVFVKNTHQTQIIDLQLDRYFYDVRQAGRSMFPLKPDGSQALGCSRVFDAEQRWELVAASFISEAAAEERYGDFQ
ncbi:hypothetical protein [Methylophaga sp. UBA2689]|jgi:hypothetical protein|uniref:hypothetical protein n=1 Tax=Methylophaga sp. UBA2689 TaxID=1946878 RepID=UPI0025F6A0BF|nr:hypothetical protein [Methylophaga sp. UBA2689]|tara:strand:- start:246 stop:632 length:387 start_codon:yes stop_codon:yes gene_type:complete